MHAIKSPTVLEWEEFKPGDKYWLTSTNGQYLQYFIYRLSPRDWRGGYVAYGHTYDFKSLKFSSAHVAIKYCQHYESDETIYVAGIA